MPPSTPVLKMLCCPACGTLWRQTTKRRPGARCNDMRGDWTCNAHLVPSKEAPAS